MKSFKEFLAESKSIAECVQLFEHEVYKRIQGSQNSYRLDTGNTNTKTITHSHVFTKQNGRGAELYSVKIDGKGHDGSSGVTISTTHADFFRSKGFNIPPDNILETLDIKQLDTNAYTLILIEDSES